MGIVKNLACVYVEIAESAIENAREMGYEIPDGHTLDELRQLNYACMGEEEAIRAFTRFLLSLLYACRECMGEERTKIRPRYLTSPMPYLIKIM